MIHLSHLGYIKSTILTGLRQTYIDGFCPSLGVGIKISSLLASPVVIDPNEECCITMCSFLLTHIFPRTGDELKRPTKRSFHVFSFDNTEEKVVVRFEAEKGQDLMDWVHPSNNPKDYLVLMTWVPPSNNSNDCKGNLWYTSIRLFLILWIVFWYPYSLCTPEAIFLCLFKTRQKWGGGGGGVGVNKN